MKRILYLVTVILFVGCNQTPSAKKNSTSEDLLNETRAREATDSLIKSATKMSFLDSTGMENSPVLVMSATLFKEEYSNYKSIKLKYKNVSDKTIEAIRFEWYGENSFGEPADMGSSIIGAGSGFTEERLKAGSSGWGTWSISSKDGKNILMARTCEVAFADGTKWKLRND